MIRSLPSDLERVLLLLGSRPSLRVIAFSFSLYRQTLDFRQNKQQRSQNPGHRMYGLMGASSQGAGRASGRRGFEPDFSRVYKHLVNTISQKQAYPGQEASEGFSASFKRSEPTTKPADVGLISRSSLQLSFVFETCRVHKYCPLNPLLAVQTSSEPRPAMAPTNTPLSPPLAEDTTATSRNVSL